MQKKINIFKYTTVGIAVLLILLSFQEVQTVKDGLIQLLSSECFSKGNNKSPLESFLLNPDECTDNGDYKKYIKLEKSNNKYRLTNQGRSVNHNWYSDELKLMENPWLNWLAIANPEIELISIDSKSGILVFVDSISIRDGLSIWVWKIKVNSNERPKELKLVNLIGGDKYDRDFIDFLTQNDGKQYKKSNLSLVIQNWLKNPNSNYEIISILTDNCIYKNMAGLKFNCLENADKGKEVFDRIDRVKDQPTCLTEALQNPDYEGKLNLLIKKGDSFEVWSSNGGAITPAEHLKNSSLQGDKYFAWVTILCLACRFELDNFVERGEKFYVFACGTYLACVKENSPALYFPINLINKNLQGRFIDFLNNRINYDNSNVKILIREWARDTLKKYTIKAIENPDTYRYTGDSNKISNFIDPNEVDFSRSLSFLLKKFNGGDYYTTQNGKDTNPSWFSQVPDTGNIWLAQLAAIDPGLKLLDKGSNKYTFVTSVPNPYLWSWKLNTSPSRPDEYAPLKNLYDKSSTGKAIAIAYAKAIKANPGLFDTYLQKNIREYFNGNDEKIIQVYPQNFTKKSDSPFGILGESDPPNATNKMPQPLFDVFSSVGHTATSKMQYIVENDRGDFSIKGSSNTSPNISWFKGVSHFKDPWVAWLCLADPNMKLVAANPGTPTRLCMTLSEDYSTLWSWDANLNPQDAPIQKKLVEKESKFELSGNPIKDYLMLPLSDEEKTFFLSRADQNDKISFVLSDFFEYIPYDSNRILLWRINSPSERKLFRVGKGINQDEAITVHQVDQNKEQAFAWDEISTRYKQAWFTGSFKEHLARTNLTSLDTWFGKQRLGISMGDQVGVFLDNARYRSFGFTGFSNINSLVNDIVYISLGRVKPEKNVFFHSWVDGKWDRTIWRANPLGLFDRVANSKSSNQ